MAPVAPSQSSSPHVPAWRRLGLKLKSAGNLENLAPIASQHLPNHASVPELNTNSKRQRDQSSYSTDTPPTKKTKSSKASKKNSSPPPEVRQSLSSGLKKRKSVTFTPETKTDDGDSIKQLFNAWVDEQKEEDPSFGTKRSIQAFKTPEPPQVAEQVEDTALTESDKRVKRVKKIEKAKKEKISDKSLETSVPQRLSPALSYLRQYCDSRDTWKFNKNHQNFIIKHLFDITKIPLDHNEVLHHYISGVQGGVRTRLRDEAIKVKIQDQEAGSAGFPSNMSDLDRKQQEYNAAMAEYVANVTMRDAPPAMGYEEGIAMNLSDSTMRERVGKRMRAERILAQLGRESEASQSNAAINGGDRDSQKRMRLNDGSAQKTARKRKQRTTAMDGDDDDDSSSSSSSGSSSEESTSESESDSEDSEDSDESAGRATRDVDETSSSSSSSSSSGSGSESGGSDDESEDE